MKPPEMGHDTTATSSRGLPTSFAGRHVAIIGLAREGMALARLCLREGATVTVSDAWPAEALRQEVDELTGIAGMGQPARLRLALGANRPQDILDASIVFASPGVPLDSPLLEAARSAAIPISSLTELFFTRCQAPIVGITGSSGKTTTTTLIGLMLRRGQRPIYVGGNIGTTLIEDVASIPPEARVVLELSSFQLEELRRSPSVAVVTNITPNHLDRHGTMEAYIEAKSHILRYQTAGDWLALNADDPATPYLRSLSTARPLAFSLRGPAAVSSSGAELGAYLDGERLTLLINGCPQVICRADQMGVPGLHNVANALAAAAVAANEGIPVDQIAAVLRAFQGVPHRLELVRDSGGVRWYNDSIATTPERTLAALSVFPEQPIVLLAGGRDKHLPWEALADRIVGQCRALVVFGEAADLIIGHVQAARRRALAAGQHGLLVSDEAITRCASLEEAVLVAARWARPGDVALLSPGGTSYDMFKDFEERGARFRDLVGAGRPVANGE